MRMRDSLTCVRIRVKPVQIQVHRKYRMPVSMNLKKSLCYSISHLLFDRIELYYQCRLQKCRLPFLTDSKCMSTEANKIQASESDRTSTPSHRMCCETVYRLVA